MKPDTTSSTDMPSNTDSTSSPGMPPLPLNGLPNFRDFGGYATTDGRHVREGVLYRSQAFGGATEADLEYLAGLDIRLVCDLRSELERQKAADRWPVGAGPTRLYFDIRNDARAGQSELIETIRSEPNPSGVHRGMMLIYRGMPAAFAPVLPQLFEHLLDPRHLPMVIHCHAGKDRTGFICAVILAALGVEPRHITADYLLTGERINRGQLSLELVGTFSDFVGVPLTVEALQVALDVKPEFLEAAMHSLDVDYGGIEGYLQSAGKLSAANRQQLRDNLLR
jgi:protein-tyrosine phosphatase